MMVTCSHVSSEVPVRRYTLYAYFYSHEYNFATMTVGKKLANYSKGPGIFE